MANEELLNILTRGIESWKAWRSVHDLPVLDFSHTDLAEINLQETNLAGANFNGTSLRNAQFQKANLSAATFRNAELNGAILVRANLSNSDLSGAHLIGADLRGANLYGARLDNAIFKDADLRGASLIHASMLGARFDGAQMRSDPIDRTKPINRQYRRVTKLALGFAPHTDFQKVDLSSGMLRSGDFRGANFLEANLSDADLSAANLQNANLTKANLRDTNLTGADLSGANLCGADVTFARVGQTTFANTDLRRVIGLENLTHLEPSEISISTIYRSKGVIPEEFLRGCGVPDSFISQIERVIGAMQSIEFYSCFISYSSKDQRFAERLYEDLQSKGVRCWYAPEDLKIGETARVAIDKSILQHEKVLLILSRNSIVSQWVEKEVETAMEKERQQNRTILFPIRLDQSVFKVESGWAADIRRSRNIGDFRRWPIEANYVKAFDRLLRDLQAGVRY